MLKRLKTDQRCLTGLHGIAPVQAFFIAVLKVGRLTCITRKPRPQFLWTAK
ncbi:hypothetical protein GGQ08_000481 [Salinibacter ruber]|nr:hypothetical protein [Salinibacter ruber]MCS3652441.1 hypothetical protein [Salinibacter ruber]